MTEAARLLAEVEAAGAAVVLDGDGMKVRGAAALPDSLVQELRDHRDEIRESLQPSPRRWNPWPQDIQEIIEWFLKSQPPMESFRLKQAVTVTDPARYWRGLRADVAAGPATARNHYGAVQADLRALYSQFGPHAPGQVLSDE